MMRVLQSVAMLVMIVPLTDGVGDGGAAHAYAAGVEYAADGYDATAADDAVDKDVYGVAEYDADVADDGGNACASVDAEDEAAVAVADADRCDAVVPFG